MTDEAPQPSFVYTTCRRESQSECKKELAINHPELQFAFSRPGLMTFRVDNSSLYRIDKPFHLKSIFARTYGWSLELSKCDIAELWNRNFQKLPADQRPIVHAWSRIESATESTEELAGGAIGEEFRVALNNEAKQGQNVIDLIQVEENQWLFGFHVAATTFQRWPGGKPVIDPPSEPISRAYFKTGEAIRWSQLPLRRRDVCVEIGAAPGGSAQYLLEQGCQVIAIDPADLDSRLNDNDQLVHWKCRGREVKKIDVPKCSLAIRRLECRPELHVGNGPGYRPQSKVHVQGMLLTLKLMEGIPFTELLKAKEQVQSWGFKYAKLRQLAHHRNEVCLAAFRHKADRRVNRTSRKSKQKK